MRECFKLINVDKKVECRDRDHLEGLLRVPRLRQVRAERPSKAAPPNHYYRLVLPHFRNAIIPLTPAWAGDRVLHIGDYAKSSPPTCPEFRFQPYEWTPGLSQIQQEAGEAAANPLYHLVPSRQPNDDYWGPPRSSLQDLMYEFTEEDYDLCKRLVEQMTLPPSSDNSDVLRILDLKQHVRLEALLLSDDIEDLGELIEAYITWTDVHHRVHDRVGTKGPWAGCKLDIVDANDFERREGWEDVTFEVLGLNLEGSEQDSESETD